MTITLPKIPIQAARAAFTAACFAGLRSSRLATAARMFSANRECSIRAAFLFLQFLPEWAPMKRSRAWRRIQVSRQSHITRDAEPAQENRVGGVKPAPRFSFSRRNEPLPAAASINGLAIMALQDRARFSARP
jgi:hypothetical protein